MLAVAIFFGSFVLMGVEALAIRVDIEDGGRELVSTWLNPYVAVADAAAFPYDDLTGVFEGSDLPTPMDPLRLLVSLRQGVNAFDGDEEIREGAVLGVRAHTGMDSHHPDLWGDHRPVSVESRPPGDSSAGVAGAADTRPGLRCLLLSRSSVW